MGSNRQHPSWQRRQAGALIVAGALALVACGGSGDDSGPTSEAAAAEPAADEPADDVASDAGALGDLAIGGGRSVEGTGDPGDPAIDLGAIGRDVIIEMRVTMSSDDIQRSVAAVTARAAALGGGIASSEVDYGNRGTDDSARGYAVIVVKVPPTAVDDLLSGLERAGTIQSINQSAQDVTEQLVDLDVRISNARQSVENVRGFMERTENLNELVTLEGELTRRQTELERLEAQQRNLSERVAFSTVTVEIIPTELVPQDPGDDSIGDAFEKGWNGFIGTLWAIGYVLAVLLPFLVLAGIVALVASSILRRRGRAGAPAPGLAPPPGESPQTAEPSSEPEEGSVSVGDGDANRSE